MKSQLHIGIYSPYFKTSGGGERYMLTIAEHWSTKHSVDIFWDNLNEIDHTSKLLSINLSKVRIVPNIFTPHYNILKRITITKKYDMIVYLSDGSIPLLFSKFSIIHFQRPFPMVRIHSLLAKNKISRINSIVCNSEFTKKYIDQEYNVNSLVIYPPVTVDSFSPKVKNKVILSVARFQPVKKQDLLIKIFNSMSNVLPGWELHLVGSLTSEDSTYYSKLTNIKKDTIKLLPDLSFEELKHEYETSSIYWHATGFGEDEGKHPEHMEHFGIAPVEAMSAGSIPIVYAGGGLTEIIKDGDNGYLFQSVEECIAKTQAVIEATERIRNMIRNRAISTAQRFSKKSFTQSFDSLLSMFQTNQ